MRRIKVVLAAACMAMLLAAFAAPAMARSFNHNFFNPFFGNNGVSQSNEQAARSGDSTQTITATGGGDNSNACQGIQGINNTGNAVTNTGVLQYASGGGNNRFHRGGEVGVGGVGGAGTWEMKPSQSNSCDQKVNQAASASGQ